MAKSRRQYVCQQCGRVSPVSLGRCPQCGSWDSMVEEVIQESPSKMVQKVRGINVLSKPRKITEIDGDVEKRLELPIDEFARVLGGGIVPGSIVLVGGDPGIGKSTLLLQVAMQMAKESKVLYVSGEESERQIKMRAVRLSSLGEKERTEMPEALFLVTETNLDTIFEHIRDLSPDILIVDSIQTMFIGPS